MTTIFTHHDADGVTSAYFTSFALEDPQIVITKKFGETKDWEDGDYMTDMRPDNPKVKGTVIDHHLPHPKERNYELITHLEENGYNAPASLVAWQEFKDKIPKEHWWKLAIGVVGDGQPEKIPAEVIKEHPILMKKVPTSAFTRYGKITINSYPLYNMLSSGINALLRCGEYDEAMNQMMLAPHPLALYQSSKIKKYKRKVSTEFDRIVGTARSSDGTKDIYTFGDLVVIFFKSNLRMTGYISSRLQDSFDNKTLLSIEEASGSMSLRGDLSLYYRDILNTLDYVDLDGHPGFMGGTFTGTKGKMIEDLLEML